MALVPEGEFDENRIYRFGHDGPTNGQTSTTWGAPACSICEAS